MNAGRTYRIYVFAVLALGLGTVAMLSSMLGESSWELRSHTDVLLWMAMITVAAMSPVPMPRGNSAVSLTSALDFGALLVFGPAVACWFALIASLIHNTSGKWNPFADSILRVGQGALAIGAAGIVYLAAGGRVGGELVLDGVQIPAMVAAGVVYVVLQSGVPALGGRIRSAGGAPSADWTRLRRHALSDAMLFPFGLLLALTQLQIGPVGVALFLIPLLVARYAIKLWIETRNAHLRTVRVLMSSLDSTDPFTAGHSYRISKMAVRVARRLGLPEKEIEELEYAALLHDLGRTGVDHGVWGKTGRLSSDEHAELRNHPRIGFELLRELQFFEEAAGIVHAHHEQPDGKGYPRGLSGDAIPMGSRIIMVVAAFDAMTSDRPYRQGLQPAAALEELLAHSGTQFFPEVVEALIELYSAGQLFEEFDEQVLRGYAEGRFSSRSVEEYVDGLGWSKSVPPKRGASFEDDLVIEMPPVEPVRAREDRVVVGGKGTWQLDIASRTDVGCVRTNNEDAFGVIRGSGKQAGCLLVVADGMGGAAAGEVASGLAVDLLSGYSFEKSSDEAVAHALESAVAGANREIHDRAASSTQLSGMGTTCTAALVVGDRGWIAHVGDSRAYLVENGEIRCLTRDHTLAAELERVSGGEHEGGVHAANMLTRNLGSEPEVEVDVTSEPVKLGAGSTLVLCSDGLWGCVSPAEIVACVEGTAPEAACRRLVDLARERGGPDNVTVQVARLEKH